MTYRQLTRILSFIPDDYLDNDVSVLQLDSDEVHPVCDLVTPKDWKEKDVVLRSSFGIDQVDGVLDEGHPYFTVIS